ncbi:MAG TPA: glycosyltransferase family 2 protein [Bacteroidales bacterium]|nr:glycosyltransferase family 2 protein [Bacteroidales bacterium]HPS70685.1 glycosyltransferase family 2 protein [Bacteroidales bacterium]
MDQLQQQIEILKVCLVLPTYNHATFIENVLLDCIQYPIDILIINDGSTDQTQNIVDKIISNNTTPQTIELISFPKNRGKGAAIKAGAKRAIKLGYKAIITMDSDGQHFPSDLNSFIQQAIQTPHAIIIGSRGIEHENMPRKNTTANKISNFWFHFQTAIDLPDTQSGYRYYPLSCFQRNIWFTDRYNFELEIMVRNIWRGYQVIPIPIHVYYPPEGVRITHFRPTVDFLRITLLNTFLSIIAVIYFYPKYAILSIFKTQKHKH